jgi:hypothetical protein
MTGLLELRASRSQTVGFWSPMANRPMRCKIRAGFDPREQNCEAD